jgi:UDP-glucose 4-epimerase
MLRATEQVAEELATKATIVHCDIADLENLKSLFQGIDTVVHLAATPDPNATWSEILALNIVGTYNVFAAAKAANCRRVVFASSIHAVTGYPQDVQVKTTDPVNPGDLYGVSKCFGEALGRYLAEQEGISVIAIRIGAFQPHENVKGEGALTMLDAWVSERDLAQLICRCIDDTDIRFAIFHGLSDNRFKRLDITDARERLGYEPQDDFAAENRQLAAIPLPASTESVLSGELSGMRDDVR